MDDQITKIEIPTVPGITLEIDNRLIEKERKAEMIAAFQLLMPKIYQVIVKEREFGGMDRKCNKNKGDK